MDLQHPSSLVHPLACTFGKTVFFISVSNSCKVAAGLLSRSQIPNMASDKRRKETPERLVGTRQ